MPPREAYSKRMDLDLGVRLAMPEKPAASARASALLVAGSYCGAAVSGAAVAALISGQPLSAALSWFGQGSAEAGGIFVAGAAVLLHWPFKWAIDHWW
jgi:hypothetical protein